MPPFFAAYDRQGGPRIELGARPLGHRISVVEGPEDRPDDQHGHYQGDRRNAKPVEQKGNEPEHPDENHEERDQIGQRRDGPIERVPRVAGCDLRPWLRQEASAGEDQNGERCEEERAPVQHAIPWQVLRVVDVFRRLEGSVGSVAEDPVGNQAGSRDQREAGAHQPEEHCRHHGPAHCAERLRTRSVCRADERPDRGAPRGTG